MASCSSSCIFSVTRKESLPGNQPGGTAGGLGQRAPAAGAGGAGWDRVAPQQWACLPPWNPEEWGLGQEEVAGHQLVTAPNSRTQGCAWRASAEKGKDGAQSEGGDRPRWQKGGRPGAPPYTHTGPVQGASELVRWSLMVEAQERVPSWHPSPPFGILQRGAQQMAIALCLQQDKGGKPGRGAGGAGEYRGMRGGEDVEPEEGEPRIARDRSQGGSQGARAEQSSGQSSCTCAMWRC